MHAMQITLTCSLLESGQLIADLYRREGVRVEDIRVVSAPDTETGGFVAEVRQQPTTHVRATHTPRKQPKARAGNGDGSRMTAAEVVMKLASTHRKGFTSVEAVKALTERGLNKNTVHGTLHRLKKEGSLKTRKKPSGEGKGYLYILPASA